MATYRDDWRLKGFFKGIGAIVLTGGGAIAFGNSALAQITIVPDATLGAESSTVTAPIPGGFLIEGGATRETNLFHSFEEFSIPSEGIAYFNNALTVENIISRVTGTSVSNIDGLIAANGTANLFLINPNGIEFGSKAALNLGGSFLASTANSLIFDNGFEFSATNPQSPLLLSVNLPLGLQYGANPGRILTQSSVLGLQVPTGKTLALVGGEVDIEGGFLFAPDGHIELGSVAGNSRVNLRATNTGYALNYEGVENFQDIGLTQKAFVVAGGNNGGSIQVQGRNLTLTDGAQISVGLQGAGVGGDLTVNASESVQVIGTSADGRNISGLFTRSEETATGKTGDLTINTPWLLIRDGGAVNASTLSAGKGGNVTVNASQGVQVIGTSLDGQWISGLAVTSFGTGDAGDLTIITPGLLIQDGAAVIANTFGAGKGGI
jgi:filamentous hemagglutinin family protein